MLFIAFLLLFVGLSGNSAFATSPFSEKGILELSERASTSSSGSAEQARSESGEADSQPCTLAVMADLHAKPESLPMLQKAVASVNSLKDVFALAIAGDLCSKLGTSGEYEAVRRGLKNLSVPVYAVPGNHDILYKDNLISGEKKRGTPAEKKHKQELFKKTLNLKSLYYANKAGGHLLVFLPNDSLTGIPCVLPSDDAFEFLRKTLRENRDLPTIVFCHAPLAGSYGDKKTMPPLQANAQPVRKIQKILKENPQVYLWFAGHLHITPSQKYFNSPENKVGGVTVIHVPPSQIHCSWIQTVRLSPKGATVRTMDVKSGKYLKRHTRVFRHGIKGNSDNQSKDSDKDKNKDKNKDKDNDKGLKKARIVVVNAHAGGNRNRSGFGDWLADQEPDVALVSESVDMRQHMRDAGRVYDAGSETRGRREVTVVVRDGLPVSAHDHGKISPDLGLGIAHDRWWTRVQTSVAGLKSRVYSLHLNAVIQQSSGEPRAVNRWTVTREGLVDLEKRLKEDIKDGWAVIIGGDLNWNDSRTNASSHRMSPGRIFKRLGLTYVNNELMWLAWTPDTHKLVKRHIIPPTSIPGLFVGEHPALRIDLQARNKPDKPESDKEESEHDTSGEESDEESSDTQGDSGAHDEYEDPEEIKEADEADSSDVNQPDQQNTNESAVDENVAAVVARLIELIRQLMKGVWAGIMKILQLS